MNGNIVRPLEGFIANEQLVSVIIPVYNVSRYLPQCFDSVIETLSNPQQSWGESCTQVAITKATEKNSVVYYVRV